MRNVLEKICADKRAHVAALKQKKPFELIHREALAASPVRGFAMALLRSAEKDGVGFITEIKKASPSAGLIRPDFSPKALAQAYEHAGAACLSVLTDSPYFKGQNQDLLEAREACALPVLRKDFMVDPWQIAESRSLGADCVLLIMAALDDSTARALHRAAVDYGMDVLVEVHDREELDRALALPSSLIGVNSRNLKTMTTDLASAGELVRSIPRDRFAVSESGIRTADDVALMRDAGARGFLVGESLLIQADVGFALQKLRP